MNKISRILATQKMFFKTQKTKDVTYRLSLLIALKEEIICKEQAIYDALYQDFKKSEFEVFLSEYALTLKALNLAIKNLKKWTKPNRVKASMLSFPSSDYIYKEPYGTVLIISPWNYPFILAMAPIIMAIAAGNTVVLKPSELTQNTAKLLSQIISKVFPKMVLVSVEGGVDVSTELLAQKWDYIFFTGSTKVGKIVAKAAAGNLTPVTLELGGKSPCIIDETIDLKLVAKRLVWGKLFNAGQTCIAPDYVLVKSHIKTKLIDLLKIEITKAYGKNTKTSNDFPRIINKKNLLRLKELLKDTNMIFGGDSDERTYYLAPTLVDEPSLQSDLMTDEIFGPILPILSYETESDIESIIYGLDKPLSLYVFSKNKKFINKIINKYSFGGGVINDSLIHFGNQKLPFGGVGASGMGAYHGKTGFDTFSHSKSIVKRGTWFDPPFRYAPYKGKLGLLKKMFKYLT